MEAHHSFHKVTANYLTTRAYTKTNQFNIKAHCCLNNKASKFNIKVHTQNSTQKKTSMISSQRPDYMQPKPLLHQILKAKQLLQIKASKACIKGHSLLRVTANHSQTKTSTTTATTMHSKPNFNDCIIKAKKLMQVKASTKDKSRRHNKACTKATSFQQRKACTKPHRLLNKLTAKQLQFQCTIKAHLLHHSTKTHQCTFNINELSMCHQTTKGDTQNLHM